MLSHQTENYTNTHYHRHDRYDHDGDLFDHNDSLLLDSDGPLCDLRQKHETYSDTHVCMCLGVYAINLGP